MNKPLDFKKLIQAGLDTNKDGVWSSPEQVEMFAKVVVKAAEFLPPFDHSKAGRAHELEKLTKTPEEIQKLFPQMAKDFDLKLKVEPISLEQAKVMAPIYNDAVKKAIAQRN